MLLSTQAPTMPSVTLSNYRPLTKVNLRYEAFMAIKKVDSIWVDGHLVPWDQATDHLLAHTMHYGVGCFEGIRAYLQEDGSTSLLRGTWWQEGKDVREKAERSRDGGKTWVTAFDIVFRPHVD